MPTDAVSNAPHRRLSLHASVTQNVSGRSSSVADETPLTSQRGRKSQVHSPRYLQSQIKELLEKVAHPTATQEAASHMEPPVNDYAHASGEDGGPQGPSDDGFEQGVENQMEQQL